MSISACHAMNVADTEPVIPKGVSPTQKNFISDDGSQEVKGMQPLERYDKAKVHAKASSLT